MARCPKAVRRCEFEPVAAPTHTMPITVRTSWQKDGNAPYTVSCENILKNLFNKRCWHTSLSLLISEHNSWAPQENRTAIARL